MAKLIIRKATIEDMDLVFRWANDEEERKNSFNPEKILYEDHCNWFKKRLEALDCAFYILMDGDSPAGKCRLNFENSEAVISYSVAPSYRGRGLGKKLLLLVKEAVKEEYPDIKTLVAQVKEDNIPSQKVFLSLGYEETMNQECRIREYRLEI